MLKSRARTCEAFVIKVEEWAQVVKSFKYQCVRKGITGKTKRSHPSKER